MAARIDCPSNRINYKSAKNANGALIIKRLLSSVKVTPVHFKFKSLLMKQQKKFSLNVNAPFIGTRTSRRFCSQTLNLIKLNLKEFK